LVFNKGSLFMGNADIFPAIKRAFGDAVCCCGPPVIPTIESECIVDVDCGLSFEEMVKNSNLLVTKDVNEERFPIVGMGKYKAKIAIFSFEGNPETKRVVEEMAKKYYRPSNIEEIFALAAKHPEIIGNFLIALGSTWEFRRKLYSPIIMAPHGIRELGVTIAILNWCNAFKFAGTRIVQA